MDHHRRSLMDMGGSICGAIPEITNGAGGMDDIDGGGRGFDGRSGGSSGGGGGYHVSPAVVISRRGRSKRYVTMIACLSLINDSNCSNAYTYVATK